MRASPFPIFYSLPIYSLPTFGIGVALAELHHRGFKGSGWALPAFVLVLAWAGHYNARYAGLNFIVLPLVAMSLLFAARYRGSALVNGVSIYLGDISYAFFVYQIPLLLALEHWIGFARSLPLPIIGAGMLGINLLLAALSHKWIEPWGRKLIVRHWAGVPAFTARPRSQLPPARRAA